MNSLYWTKQFKDLFLNTSVVDFDALDSKKNECQAAFELIRKHLYAKDADLVAHSLIDIQEIMNHFADAGIKFGLTINLGKTNLSIHQLQGIRM